MIGFYMDSGLAVPASLLTAMQASDGSPPAAVRTVWLGTTETDRAWYAASNPGVANIVVSIDDSAGGAALLPATLRLALSEGGLASATPGSALVIDTEIGPGSANAIAVWVGIDIGAMDSGAYDNLSLVTNPLISQVAP